MPIAINIINLDRSPDRLEKITQSAQKVGLAYNRISAVDGASLDIENCNMVDVARFMRCHGKHILNNELGCYLSHLKALSHVVDKRQEFAVIVEDDVAFHADFSAVVEDIIALKGWDMVKLVNHRSRGFRRYFTLKNGYHLGRCLHGPCGSSAAYMVTLKGAQLLLDNLMPMYLPYDVAIERGWGGYASFTLDKPIVDLSAMGSTIIKDQNDYKNMRLARHKRLAALKFRTSDYIQRLGYGFGHNNLSKF